MSFSLGLLESLSVLCVLCGSNFVYSKAHTNLLFPGIAQSVPACCPILLLGSQPLFAIEQPPSLQFAFFNFFSVISVFSVA